MSGSMIKSLDNLDAAHIASIYQFCRAPSVALLSTFVDSVNSKTRAITSGLGRKQINADKKLISKAPTLIDRTYYGRSERRLC